jgi:hypothetical protein
MDHGRVGKWTTHEGWSDLRSSSPAFCTTDASGSRSHATKARWLLAGICLASPGASGNHSSIVTMRWSLGDVAEALADHADELSENPARRNPRKCPFYSRNATHSQNHRSVRNVSLFVSFWHCLFVLQCGFSALKHRLQKHVTATFLPGDRSSLDRLFHGIRL